jgi:hypothetical protein
LRPTNAQTIFVMLAIDADLHQMESALARPQRHLSGAFRWRLDSPSWRSRFAGFLDL